MNDFLTDGGSFCRIELEVLTKFSARTKLKSKSGNALARHQIHRNLCYSKSTVAFTNFERSGKERSLHLTRFINDDNDGVSTRGSMVSSLLSQNTEQQKERQFCLSLKDITILNYV